MSAPVRTRPASSDADEARRAKAIAEAREARALIAAGKIDVVVDRIMDRYPKVMDRLAK